MARQACGGKKGSSLRDQIKQFCLKGMNVFARARLAAAKPLAKTGLPGKRVNPVCVGLRLNNIY